MSNFAIDTSSSNNRVIDATDDDDYISSYNNGIEMINAIIHLVNEIMTRIDDDTLPTTIKEARDDCVKLIDNVTNLEIKLHAWQLEMIDRDIEYDRKVINKYVFSMNNDLYDFSDVFEKFSKNKYNTMDVNDIKKTFELMKALCFFLTSVNEFIGPKIDLAISNDDKTLYRYYMDKLDWISKSTEQLETLSKLCCIQMDTHSMDIYGEEVFHCIHVIRPYFRCLDSLFENDALVID